MNIYSDINSDPFLSLKLLFFVFLELERQPQMVVRINGYFIRKVEDGAMMIGLV